MSYPPPHGSGYRANSSDQYNVSSYPQGSNQGYPQSGYSSNAQASNQGYQASNYQAGYPPQYPQGQGYQSSNYQGNPPPNAQDSYKPGYPPTAQGSYQGYPQTATGAPAVVGPQYCLPHPTSFVVVKHVLSLSDGDWTINDTAGNRVFRVSGRLFSIRDKRFLLDGAGNKILRMQGKIFTLHDTWYMYHGDSEHLICTVKKSSLVQLKPSMDIFLASNTAEKVPDFKLVGNYLERDLTVYFGQQPIAQMAREITFVNMIVGKDTFGVTVFPGVDQAFIFGLVVIMDAVYLHKHGENSEFSINT